MSLNVFTGDAAYHSQWRQYVCIITYTALNTKQRLRFIHVFIARTQ